MKNWHNEWPRKAIRMSATSMIELLRAADRPIPADLLEWMLRVCKAGDRVEVENWMDSRFYFEILFKFPKYSGIHSPANMRMMFSVDMATGGIMWNDEGGNCMVRDPYYKRRLRERYGDFLLIRQQINKPAVAFYKDSPVPGTPRG